jgi:choline kinase
MDADVLFPKQFLSLLIRSPHPNLMLLDQTSESQGEEQMLLIKKGRIVESTKRVQGEYDLLGEGVGFLKLSASAAPCLKRLLQDFIDKEQIDLEYEDVFKFLFQEVDVCYEPVGGLPWTEIDFPEDIRRAEEIILPRLMEYEREIC